MRLAFEHDGRRRYWSHIHRDDGVVFHFAAFDRKWRVPHDLAHVATEGELGRVDGVLGSIADGAIFDNMTVVSGRLRHDARRRSEEVLRRNKGGIGLAELLVGAVHRAVEGRDRRTLFTDVRAVWGSTTGDPLPYDERDLNRVADALADLSSRWTALPTGATLSVDWPPRPAPAPRHGNHRRPRR